LRELESRNLGITTRFRQIDANRFTGVVYRDGKAVARCKVMLGGMFGKGISYSNNDEADDRSHNESLSVEADSHGLYLKPLGFGIFGEESKGHLTFEGAAEYYWAMFIRALRNE
jgi:hypothetical protein